MRSSGHNTFSNYRGEQPIVRIGHREWSSISNKARGLFRKQKEETVMVVALEKSKEDSKENGSSKVRGRPPCCKRNTVRARGGIVGVSDGEKNRIEVRLVEKRRVDGLSITAKERDAASRVKGGAPLPNGAPELLCKGGFLFISGGRRGVS